MGMWWQVSRKYEANKQEVESKKQGVRSER